MKELVTAGCWPKTLQSQTQRRQYVSTFRRCTNLDISDHRSFFNKVLCTFVGLLKVNTYLVFFDSLSELCWVHSSVVEIVLEFAESVIAFKTVPNAQTLVTLLAFVSLPILTHTTNTTCSAWILFLRSGSHMCQTVFSSQSFWRIWDVMLEVELEGNRRLCIGRYVSNEWIEAESFGAMVLHLIR